MQILNAHTNKTTRLIANILGVVLLWVSSPAFSNELRILTSLPPALFEPFTDRFERSHPDDSVVVLNKNTNSAIEEVVRGNARMFDVFWSSSPEAFEVLKSRDLMRNDNIESANSVNASNATPSAQVYPFALSSIGWAWHDKSYIQHPNSWEDLLDPKYVEKIGMAPPSRSGTAHTFVERFLQVRGWDEGWAYILELAANLSTLTSRSFDVIDGVANRRFELGISIDFLAQSAEHQSIKFTYGHPLMMTRAQIGTLAGGGSPQLAEEFIKLVLSEEGQALLLEPQIHRIPISEKIRSENPDAFPEEVKAALKLSWLSYDPILARDRYWSVNTLFDQFITFQFAERREIWIRLRELEKVASAQQIGKLATVRRILTTMPVVELEASAAGLNENPTPRSDFSTTSDLQELAIDQWAELAAEQLNNASIELSAIEDEIMGGE